MNAIAIGTPDAASDLPTTLLRADMIEPGDVLLTYLGGSSSKIVANLSSGEFSHAALLVNSRVMFESDYGGIDLKPIKRLGIGTIAGVWSDLGRLPAAPKRLAVYRHPGLKKLPAGAFAEALWAELRHSCGRDYADMHRLVMLAKPPDWLMPLDRLQLAAQLKQMIAATLKHYDRVVDAVKLYGGRPLARKIPGPFCSELVARVYERMGLALFPDRRPTWQISPNDLAKSNLVPVEGIAISWGSIVDFRHAEQLHLETDDVAAQILRHQRAIEREVDTVLGRIGEHSRRQRILASALQQLIEIALQLVKQAQASRNERLTRWTLRIAERSLESAHELTVPNLRSPDIDSMNAVALKLIELYAPILRRSTFSTNALLRGVAAIGDGGLKLFKLHRARRSIFKMVRLSRVLRRRNRVSMEEVLSIARRVSLKRVKRRGRKWWLPLKAPA
jgi:hypothetical protein